MRQTFEYRASEKQLQFSAQVDEAVPNAVVGDSLRLRQVLLNLLSNAVKFTEKGEITLVVELESKFSGEAWLRFLINDTGIGISPEDQDRIFAPFTQIDASTTRQYGGTGLGLTIASELIRAMGGSHAVRSELGVGSTFSFSVPLLYEVDRQGPRDDSRSAALESQELPAENDDARCDALRVLLAEDTPTNQMLVVHALQKRGHQVEVAGDGQTAVRLAAQAHYDVILMDLQMPTMDGFQATSAIRALPQAMNVPIIALTAHAMVGDRERCLAAGMDGYLAKPLDLGELLELVERSANRAAARNSGVKT
jgi:CheY-like chemotaxis protein